MHSPIKYMAYVVLLSALTLISACDGSKSSAAAVSPAKANSAATIVIDGKEWMRCSLGQNWDGNTCVGEAKKFTSNDAQTAVVALNANGFDGKKDWRAPTVRELANLRVCSKGFSPSQVDMDIQDGGPKVSKSCWGDFASPTIDTSLFPSTSPDFYRTSSPWDSSDFAWVVSFNYGEVKGDHDRDEADPLRLVRASQ
jgi:hypothetical protein